MLLSPKLLLPAVTWESPIAFLYSGPSALEPLANLSADRLVLVSEPSVTDVSLLNALRARSRKQVLRNQGTLWADDEMWLHMTQMLPAAKKSTWALIDPMPCAEALKRPSSALIGQWIRSLGFKL